MRLPLFVKLIFGYILFGVAGFIAVATLSFRLTENYLIRSRAQTLYDEAMLIASSYSAVYEGNGLQLQNAYPQLKAVATFLGTEIWVVDRTGNIIVDSADSRTGYLIPNYDPIATGNRPYMTGTFFGTFPEDVLSVSAPVTGNYRTHGYVVIHLPMDLVRMNANEILNIVYITFGIVYLLSLITLILFYLFFYFPLRKITAAARQYADGNLEYRISSVRSGDELGYLANTMNYMAEELSRSEERQRKFIANVSHDFRSPLTSIRGYLEAILDGTIPPELQEKYLRRVISESDRLTGLTQRMLTLESMGPTSTLSRSVFDINGVIRSVCESFEGQCREKRITFDLTFSAAEQPVYADMSRIQQVLYNLVDNAVKFSPSGSEIFLQSYEKKDKVFVSVKDRGPGIPKKDVGRIFDRFYKSDSSRGKDKKGTGLGLSIVKDIIQAHGETIDVISTEGVGTEFVFSLPSAEEDKE